MRFIGSVYDKLQRHPKRIVFPEGTEPRIIQTARQFHSLRLGAPILLGNRTRIKEIAADLTVSLEGVRIIDPETSEELDNFVGRFELLRHYKKEIGSAEARATILKPNFFGAMMVAMHQADGLVSGASESAGGVLRPLFQIVKTAPQATTASSCQVMEVDDRKIGDGGVLFMADCSVIPEPTLEELADIAISTARLANHLLGTQARAALTSYSTFGSASHPSIGKIKAATALANERSRKEGLNAVFDGEMQVDTALVKGVSQIKAPNSQVAGRANVLIFPDLNTGNIAS